MASNQSSLTRVDWGRGSYDVEFFDFPNKIIGVSDANDGRMSITNGAEQVVLSVKAFHSAVFQGMPGKPPFSEMRIIYKDTTGRWDQLLHKDGVFDGFRIIGTSDKIAAIKVVLQREGTHD